MAALLSTKLNVPNTSFGNTVIPLQEERRAEVVGSYAKIDFKSLKKGGHNKCWKFLTHPEGWMDNFGVILVVSLPIWVFSWVFHQGSLPSIFVLGTINIMAISASLFLIVPDSRKLRTYTRKNAKDLLNFDAKMTPNSARHLCVLASLIFQLLVLGAVVWKEIVLLRELLLGEGDPVEKAYNEAYNSLFYNFAEFLSTSLIGNMVTLAITTLTATFFGFSWFVGCFEER